MRVHANREPRVIPSRADFLRLAQFRFIVRRQDYKCATNSSGSGSLDDLVQIAGELRPGDMAMAVYQHSAWPMALREFRVREKHNVASQPDVHREQAAGGMTAVLQVRSG